MAAIRSLGRVGFLTATTGTGTLAVGAAYTDALNGDFCTPAEAGAADNDLCSFIILDGNNFEINTGTYNTAGPTLTRNTPSLAKSGGTASTTKLTLSGSAKVFFILSAKSGLSLASDVFRVDSTGPLATVDALSYTFATLPTKIAGRSVYCSDCIKPDRGPQDQKTGCMVWTDGIKWYNDEGPLSSPTPATFTGLVATNCKFPDFWSPSSVKSIQARTNHVAQDDLTAIQVVYANIAGVAEAAPGATGTLKCAIEYPDGVFQAFVFSGTATGILPNGGSLASDVLTLTAMIPKGSRFRLRPLANCSTGVGYTVFSADQYNGEGSTNSATVNAVADATTSGTVPASNVSFFPVAIIGTTSRTSVGIIGDSRVMYNDVNRVGQANSDQGPIPRSISQFYAVAAWSYPGETVTNFVAGHTIRNALAAYVTHIVDEYGYNDLSAGTTSATIITNKNTLSGYSNITGKPYICTTIECSTTTSDNWTTLPGQTVFSGEAQRIIYNTAIRTGSGAPTAMNGYIEMADPFESARNSGKRRIRYDVLGTAIANGYTTDGIHPSPYGNQKVRDADTVPMALFSSTNQFGDGTISNRMISPGGQSVVNMDGPASFSGGLGVGTDVPDPKQALAEFRFGPQWGSFNYSCNLLVSGTNANPGLGIANGFDSQWWGLINDGGTLRISTMPVPGNISTTPGWALQLYTDFTTGRLGNAALLADYIEVLSANYTLTSQTAAQKLLNATTNGAATVGVGLFKFRCIFALTGMSTLSSAFGFALGGTATKTEAWRAKAFASSALATAGNAQSSFNTTANTALVVATTSQAVGHARIEGIIRVTAGGTIIPQVSLTRAAAAVVQAGSFFAISPLDSSSTQTNIGNWG